MQEPRAEHLAPLAGGPDVVEALRRALAGVPGVEAAFVFGSFARGAVHPGSDIDVFVLGDALDEEPVRVALAEQVLEVAGLIGREVNLARYTRRRLGARRAQGGRFIRTVLAGDKRWLVGSEAALAGRG